MSGRTRQESWNTNFTVTTRRTGPRSRNGWKEYLLKKRTKSKTWNSLTSSRTTENYDWHECFVYLTVSKKTSGTAGTTMGNRIAVQFCRPIAPQGHVIDCFCSLLAWSVYIPRYRGASKPVNVQRDPSKTDIHTSSMKFLVSAAKDFLERYHP